MIKAKNFNDLPDGMAPELGPDETAIYVSLYNSKTPEGVPLVPTRFVPNRDSIQTTEGWKEIAFITRAAPEKAKKLPFGTIVFEPSGQGMLTLSGKSAVDCHLYQYLELCNFNESNTGRDTSRTPIFKRLDLAGDAKKKMDADLAKAELTIWASKAPIDELLALLQTRGVNSAGLPDATIRNQALEQALKAPFVTANSEKPKFSVDNELLPTIKVCFDGEVIKWSPTEKCLVNSETGTKYPVSGLVQTTPVAKKATMLFDACVSDSVLYDTVWGEIGKYI